MAKEKVASKKRKERRKKAAPETEKVNRLAGALPHGVAMAHRLHLAVLKAVHRHKENGNSVAVWRNGDVELISPENIRITHAKGDKKSPKQ